MGSFRPRNARERSHLENTVILLNEPVSRIAGVMPRSTLTERAMIVSLHLHAWGGRRADKKVTKEVLSARQAEDDAGSFTKVLVPREALKLVESAHDHARERHNALTLPWGEGSTRILSASMFLEHANAMAEERAACERVHREFCKFYGDFLKTASSRMGTMYNSADFPDPSKVAAKFGFEVVILPFPDVDDFRVNLGGEIEEQIRTSIESTVRGRYAEAQREVWSRLLEIVKHFAEIMGTSGKKIYATTVTKLIDIANIAPKLSLVPDPELEDICLDICEITRGLDADALRASKTIRARAAMDAKAAVERIEDKLRGAFLG
jgi:hypothetical protein